MSEHINILGLHRAEVKARADDMDKVNEIMRKYKGKPPEYVAQLLAKTGIASRSLKQFDEFEADIHEKQKRLARLKWIDEALGNKYESHQGVNTISMVKIKARALRSGFCTDAAPHWFDIREVAKDIIELEKIGHEAIKAGLLRLPFPECVIVTKCQTQKGNIAFCYRIVDHLDGVASLQVAIILPDGRAHTLNCDDLTYDSIFCAFAAFMGSRSAERVPHNSHGLAISGDRSNEPPAYTVLRLRGFASEPTGASMGERRAPRLHWRRGHIRTFKTGDRIFIAPMLVGKATDGVLVKDYRA